MATSLECDEAKRLSSGERSTWNLSGDDPARIELEITEPVILVLESQAEGLRLDADACGLPLTARILESSSRQMVIAFAEVGIHGFKVSSDGLRRSQVQAHWIRTEVVESRFIVPRQDRNLFVTSTDFYALSGVNGRRTEAARRLAGPSGTGAHLGSFFDIDDHQTKIEDSISAEVGLSLRPRLGSPVQPEQLSNLDFLLSARVVDRSWRAAKIEEDEVDPNEGGFAPHPWDAQASIPGYSKIEEDEVDPNEGGFSGCESTGPESTGPDSSGPLDPCDEPSIEEDEVDPNEGGFAPNPSDAQASISGYTKIEEDEVDPNEGGFSGCESTGPLDPCDEPSIEEDEVDPNEGGLVGSDPATSVTAQMVTSSQSVTDNQQAVVKWLADLLWPETSADANEPEAQQFRLIRFETK